MFGPSTQLDMAPGIITSWWLGAAVGAVNPWMNTPTKASSFVNGMPGVPFDPQPCAYVYTCTRWGLRFVCVHGFYELWELTRGTVISAADDQSRWWWTYCNHGHVFPDHLKINNHHSGFFRRTWTLMNLKDPKDRMLLAITKMACYSAFGPYC